MTAQLSYRRKDSPFSDITHGNVTVIIYYSLTKITRWSKASGKAAEHSPQIYCALFALSCQCYTLWLCMCTWVGVCRCTCVHMCGDAYEHVYVYMCVYLCGWLGEGHNAEKPDG